MKSNLELISDQFSTIMGEHSNEFEKYHLGKIMYTNLSRFPDSVNQVDVLTGEMETHGSVLERVVQFVKVITKLGIKKGDVIAIIGPNHMDICIPLYGAFVIGALAFPYDMSMEIDDFKRLLQIGRPKIIFCQNSKIKTLKSAMSEIDLKADLYSFGTVEDNQVITFDELMNLDTSEMQFKIAHLNPSVDGALIICTSGSTGLPKGVLLTHKSLAVRLMRMWLHMDYPSTGVCVPIISQLHWISSIFTMAPSFLLGATKVQTGEAFTADVVLNMINNYNINTLILGTPLVLAMTKHPKFNNTNFSKIKYFQIGGSDVSQELIERLQIKIPNGFVLNCYGMTETAGLISQHDVNKKIDSYSLGKMLDDLELKIVDVNTRQQLGPNQQGEALVRSDLLFKEYYNDPKATRDAYENGWFKTGDVLYYKEDGNFYFVDRIKIMLKYLNHQISPQELESTISMHAGVLEVGVTGIKVPGDGEYPIAFVVRKNGSVVSEEEIINLVKDKLSPYKQLRGGVKFIQSLPMTSTGKIHRDKLREIAAEMIRNIL